MKTLSTILTLLLTAALAIPAMIPLAWDANPETDLDGYALWVTAAGGQPVWQATAGPSATAINLTGLAPGVYSLYLTAFRNNIHSEPSNTLTLEVPADPPTPPAGVRYFIQGEITLTPAP